MDAMNMFDIDYKELGAGLLKDVYKMGHAKMNTRKNDGNFATWTPRGSRVEGVDKVVLYGLQGTIIEYLIRYWKINFFDRDIEDVLAEEREYHSGILGMAPDEEIIRELHALGYLPIEIWAIPEGTSAPLRCPLFVIIAEGPTTWIGQSLETLISAETWKTTTLATLNKNTREMLNKHALKTTGSIDGVEYQMHDFSMRGMSGVTDAGKTGSAFLLASKGTDSTNALWYLKTFYGANVGDGSTGNSVAATEHAVQCLQMDKNRSERAFLKKYWTEIFPSGIASAVCDAEDFWKVVTEDLPTLKDDIMARDGKAVIRPDSGDPFDIICGTVTVHDLSNEYSLNKAKKHMLDIIEDGVIDETPHGECGDGEGSGFFAFDNKIYKMDVSFEWNRYDYYLDDSEIDSCEEVELTCEQKGLIEVLWDIFGGTVNELGYKVLDSHIGAIYGDSITFDRADGILTRLEEKGFASLNVVFGMGSFHAQYVTRDTFNQALKSTWGSVDGTGKQLYKSPKTDTTGLKNSQKGCVAVLTDETGELYYIDELSLDEWREYTKRDDFAMYKVFENGKLLKFYTLEEVRTNIAK